ncbi:MAG: cytochrome P450 [Panacagrimonas sp.]
MNDAQRIEGVRTPDHVPQYLVVDVDIYNPTTDANRFHEAFVDFQRATPYPFVWSPHHGGHWIAVRGPDVYALYGDHERFSSRYFFVPAAPEQVPMGALTLDPPEHQPFRAFLNAGMTPKIFAGRNDFVRKLAKDVASSLAPACRCEFISQMGDVLPLAVFLDLVDLPISDRAKLGALADGTVRDPEPGRRVAAMDGLAAYLEPYLNARRGTNGEDLLSRAVNATIAGRPVTAAESLGAAIHLLMAGLDTVSSLLSFVMLFLAQNPSHRRALVEKPDLIPAASLELIRRFPIVTMARQARGDFTIEGTEFKQGDMVAVASHLFNLDPSVYERPLEVDWNRPVHKTLTFGHGPHRCPGALLGRNELVIGLQEWLRHIPDFELEEGAEVSVCGGTVAKITKLPLVW